MSNATEDRRQFAAADDTNSGRLPAARVLLVGLGNIGSYLSVLLAPLVMFMRIVDRDTVETRNSTNQLYGPTDHGRSKVDVIAERVRQLVPGVLVEPHNIDVEDLAWGDFADVDVVLAGLDSLRARQIVSEKVGTLRIPYVDGAVGAPQVVRVQVLLPGQACLECPWGPAQYRQLAIEYPCGSAASLQAPRTNAPNCAGAATAALMVAQCLKLFDNDPPRESYEINGDLASGRFIRSQRRRNERCRAPHEIAPQTIECDTPFTAATLADVLTKVEREFSPADVQLEFPKGVLKSELFRDQRFAVPEQLQPWRQRRLGEFGLRPRDRIVARANGTTTHICFDAANRK